MGDTNKIRPWSLVSAQAPLKRAIALLFTVQTAYGLLVTLIVGVAFYRSKDVGYRKLLGTGVACMLGAFALWLCDNTFCDTLKAWRAQIGPCAPILQLHAWWHFGVGMGGYIYTLFLTLLYLKTERGVPAHLTLVHSLMPRVEELKLKA